MFGFLTRLLARFTRQNIPFFETGQIWQSSNGDRFYITVTDSGLINLKDYCPGSSPFVGLSFSETPEDFARRVRGSRLKLQPTRWT